jgi:murein L,D-transpeptidase YcbB/YkuD
MKPVRSLFVLSLVIIMLAPFRLNAQIKQALKIERRDLYYPNSVERFYRLNGYQLAWIAPDTIKTHAWDAMLLLDCVKQYGLNHGDYHPKLLLYPELHDLIAQKGTPEEAAAYDILLTDAMVRFINDLHYGKLNPVYTMNIIDNGVKFKAERKLFIALKDSDFLQAIDGAQPRSKLYADLQDHMRLLVGQRSGDCYVIPPSLIRKMAVNMERLRWINTTGKNIHLTCIVREGTVINYKDIHHQDKLLEMELYNEMPALNNRLIINKIPIEKIIKTNAVPGSYLSTLLQ